MPVLTISGKYGTGENMRLKIQSSADKGEVLTGEQPVIIDRGLFDAVQARLNEQVNNHKATKTKSEAMLVGRIFDDRGNPMTPTHARKWLASSISS
jgi:site-specific DNA recombinase